MTLEGQLSFLDAPIARTTDPETSKVSAKRVTDSGSRKRDKDLLLDLIREQPGLTAMEYADRLYRRGLHWYRAYQVANKRRHDLETANDIRPMGERVCRLTGHRARTWIAVETP